MLCPICKFDKIKLLYPNNIKSDQLGDYLISENVSGQHHDIWQCQRCRHGFVDDQQLIEQVIGSYVEQSIDSLYISEDIGRRQTARKCLAKIERIYPQQGRVLDVGCYTGLFLAEAQSRGWQPEGVEVSRRALEFAHRTYRLNGLRQGKIEQVINDLPNQAYDLITMLDVIEHLVDPSLVICNMYEKIKPNGLLLISTPDITSLNAQINKESWYAILPSHLHYFSKKSLINLLNQYKFDLVYQIYQTRYFSLSYGFNRNHFSLKLGLNKIFNKGLFKKILFPLNLRDQLMLIVKKIS